MSGTVQPRKPLVKVVAYKGSKRVGARRLPAHDGDFHGAVRISATPDRLVAEVPADAASAAARQTLTLPTSQP